MVIFKKLVYPNENLHTDYIIDDKNEYEVENLKKCKIDPK